MSNLFGKAVDNLFLGMSSKTLVEEITYKQRYVNTQEITPPRKSCVKVH